MDHRSLFWSWMMTIIILEILPYTCSINLFIPCTVLLPGLSLAQSFGTKIIFLIIAMDHQLTWPGMCWHCSTTAPSGHRRPGRRQSCACWAHICRCRWRRDGTRPFGRPTEGPIGSRAAMMCQRKMQKY